MKKKILPWPVLTIFFVVSINFNHESSAAFKPSMSKIKRSVTGVAKTVKNKFTRSTSDKSTGYKYKGSSYSYSSSSESNRTPSSRPVSDSSSPSRSSKRRFSWSGGSGGGSQSGSPTSSSKSSTNSDSPSGSPSNNESPSSSTQRRFSFFGKKKSNEIDTSNMTNEEIRAHIDSGNHSEGRSYKKASTMAFDQSSKASHVSGETDGSEYIKAAKAHEDAAAAADNSDIKNYHVSQSRMLRSDAKRANEEYDSARNEAAAPKKRTISDQDKRNARSLLGVSDNASAAEIKRAWRQKSMDSHPDKNPDLSAEEATAKFNSVQDAKDALLDSN